MELNIPLLILYPSYEKQFSKFSDLIGFWMDTG